MKIGLIYPSNFSSDKSLPLGVGYLASYLIEKNEKIDISALDTGICTIKEYDTFIKKEYDLVGFSVTTRAYNEAIKIAQEIKKNSATPIVFGGPHISIMKDKVLKLSNIIDYAIQGEGEITLNELINSMKIGDIEKTTLSNIKGLIYRDGEKIIVNKSRDFIENIDDIPFPAFHLFPMERYPGKYPMITSRGCPFSCVYCASSMIWKRKWRPRSAENIISEIEYITKNYRPRPIDFHDDGFNMSLKRVHELCDQLINKNIKIPFGVRGFRADIIDQQTAQKMRKAGCSHVAIGIESADNDMLERMGKKENIESINNGINILRHAGIDVFGQFMIGNPGETIETVKKSIDFVKKSKLNRAMFGTAVPFPGTDLWEYVKKDGTFLVENDCTEYEEMPMEERIIFETPEFKKADRIKAIALVVDAGYMPKGSGRNNESKVKKITREIWFKYVYSLMPRVISYHIYFLLRKIKSARAKK